MIELMSAKAMGFPPRDEDGFAMPCERRILANAELDEAPEWIAD